MNKKFIIGVIVTSLVVMFGGATLAFKMGSGAQVEVDQGARVEVVNNTYDWGEIGIDDGVVEKEFVVRNLGSKVLKLYNANTSCACTTVQIITTDKSSPLFGMHDKSAYVTDVQPGEEARVKVVFDPAFHGPTGVGPISRQVFIQTNDPDNPEIEFLLSAVVVS